ncbi:hypothetical protein [Pseudomonas sp. SBB6]|uniref:hypothetical protein n=1 Tax=Pseudomonas sp. SBB6 TaxID=2962032 RepID=UPI0020B73DA1|nr:hypothetical protein [Pseudomonas sp. SBB6]MCP3750486.1 hypothetical protein [Pseudomonas sp. SBB6]
MLQQRMLSQVNHGPLKVASLHDVLQYQNSDITLKFCKEWDVSRSEADDIFTETKKFLYLAAHCQTECFTVSIYQPLQVIDEMWHTFLQFTDQYYHFCEHYMGGFLHHFPFTRTMLQQEIKSVSLAGTSFEKYKKEAFLAQINKTKEILGDETIIKWYGEYAHHYSIDRLNALRKPLAASETSRHSENLISAEVLAMPKEQILKFIMDRQSIVSVTCGCSGKGCGAGCACNSGHV